MVNYNLYIWAVCNESKSISDLPISEKEKEELKGKINNLQNEN